MKKCKYGFSYNSKKDLEAINLMEEKEIVKYYCPDCKTYKYTEKIKKEKNNN